MKKTYFILLIFSLLNISCNSTAKNESDEIKFDNLKFTLPNKVSKIKEVGSLKYQVYRGFRGKSKNYDILIQLENYPIWVNSENVGEDFYLSKKVVGITFIKKNCIETKEIISTLAKQFPVNFINENNNYHFAELNKIIIAVYSKKNYCYISFYSGLNKKEIQDFINGVW